MSFILNGAAWGTPVAVYGTTLAQSMMGTVANDILYAGDGNDNVYGRGNDVLWRSRERPPGRRSRNDTRCMAVMATTRSMAAMKTIRSTATLVIISITVEAERTPLPTPLPVPGLSSIVTTSISPPILGTPERRLWGMNASVTGATIDLTVTTLRSTARSGEHRRRLRHIAAQSMTGTNAGDLSTRAMVTYCMAVAATTYFTEGRERPPFGRAGNDTVWWRRQRHARWR